jgi:hypothetical protein
MEGYFIMAIKRAKSSSVGAFPAAFMDIAKRVFTIKVVADCWADLSKEGRGELLQYLETNTDGVEVEASKALKTELGNVTVKVRKSHDYDKDKIADLVESGKLNIHTIINAAKFSDKDMVSILGSSFDDIATPKQTEYIELRPSSEFKADVAATINFGNLTAEPEVAGTETIKVETEVFKTKPAKKKAAKKKIKKTTKGCEKENQKDHHSRH